MNKIILFFFLILVSTAMVLAQESHSSEIEAGKELVESGISCDKLSNEQLETIGDYYMEQMHPGEAHELMDQMMGGEGSTQLEAAHIAMAQRWYCGDYRYAGMTGGMMRGGMMNMMWGTGYGGYGMMGYGGWGFWWIISWLIGIGLLFLIWLWVIKFWREVFEKKHR